MANITNLAQGFSTAVQQCLLSFDRYLTSYTRQSIIAAKNIWDLDLVSTDTIGVITTVDVGYTAVVSSEYFQPALYINNVKIATFVVDPTLTDYYINGTYGTYEAGWSASDFTATLIESDVIITINNLASFAAYIGQTFYLRKADSDYVYYDNSVSPRVFTDSYQNLIDNVTDLFKVNVGDLSFFSTDDQNAIKFNRLRNIIPYYKNKMNKSIFDFIFYLYGITGKVYSLGTFDYLVFYRYDNLVDLQENEIDALGDGINVNFTFTLTKPPVKVGTYLLYVDGTLMGNDDGLGNLNGTGIVWGIIDYDTGVVNVQFVDLPLMNQLITSTYGYVGYRDTIYSDLNYLLDLGYTMNDLYKTPFIEIEITFDKYYTVDTVEYLWYDLLGSYIRNQIEIIRYALSRVTYTLRLDVTGNCLNPISDPTVITDGITDSYVFTLSNLPITPLSFEIYIDGVLQGVDDGLNSITGAGITAGTISYVTGLVNVQFSAIPLIGLAVTCIYNDSDADKVVTNPLNNVISTTYNSIDPFIAWDTKLASISKYKLTFSNATTTTGSLFNKVHDTQRLMGTGDDVETVFTSKFYNNLPINTGSAYFTYTIGGTLYTSNLDDGVGGITGTLIDVATIDYINGDIAVSFLTPPDGGTLIALHYTTVKFYFYIKYVVLAADNEKYVTKCELYNSIITVKYVEIDCPLIYIKTDDILMINFIG